MTRVAWLTDIHLNFVRPVQYERLIQQINAAHPDYILISGDLGEAPRLEWYLTHLESRLPCPCYFVLGNHDFYGAAIAEVKALVQTLTARSQRLHWLTAAGIVPLAPGVGLIGHEGWADGRAGDYHASHIMLNDYLAIRDFVGLDKGQRLSLLHALGDAAAEHLRIWLPSALAAYPHVIVLTHVPPFREACWHQGRISDSDWLPHYVCHAVGEALVQIMTHYPRHQLTVLCGHSHGRGSVQILDNLRVLTGGAEYGKPEIQEVFVFEQRGTA